MTVMLEDPTRGKQSEEPENWNDDRKLEYKFSQYLIPVNLRDRELNSKDATHLYSTLRGTSIEISAEVQELLELGAVSRISLDPSHQLVALGAVVDVRTDELTAFRKAFRKNTATPTGPQFTIAPTMTCNFACDYCFESHRPGLMSDTTISLLQRFMAREISRNTLPELTAGVTWFGGEPLVGLPVIRKVVNNLSKISDSVAVAGRPVAWKQSIITNGSLMTRTVSKELVALKIATAQITLDGPPRFHDSRRFSKNTGAGSFDLIINNIIESPPELSVQIRVNIDRSNVNGVNELVDVLEERGLKNRVNISLARVEKYTDGPVPISLFSSKSFAKAIEQIIHRAQARGWSISGPSPHSVARGVCQVDSPNSWVIDTDGTLKKCWAELGTPEGAVGSLEDVILAGPDQRPSRGDLETRNIFDDNDCVSCVFLPSCGGGCPKTRKARRAGRQKECPSWSTQLDLALRSAATGNSFY